jgi:large subunit ribosomal protein L3
MSMDSVIIGKKLGMGRIFRENGRAEAVTAIEAGPCLVTQVKTLAKEGYGAAQLAFGEAKKTGAAPKEKAKDTGRFKYLREFRMADADAPKIGDRLDVSLFKEGDLVNIVGISKGKGFAGGVKRHHFKGGPKTHGQSDRNRAPGAIGATTSPGHVLKGLRMAGHMGNSRVTAKGLEVCQADPARNLLLVKGTVPGGTNGLLLIKKAGVKKSAVPNT